MEYLKNVVVRRSKNFIGVLLLVIMAFFLLGSCASTGSLRGGPKDETPPQVIEDKSTPNFQTNYRPESLVFVFDEYVVVANALQQVNISPPLELVAQTKARGKKVTFKFNENEILKDETTYTINFGEAIKDFKENNILENFSYVFSTGDVLDSLYLQGNVVDGITGEPVEKATVMLYDILEDSIVLKEKPYYFAKTDKEGNYKVANLKNDTFKVVVIKDDNSSYTYNENLEQIGFLSENIVFADSSDHLDRDLILSMPLIDYRFFGENIKVKNQVKIKLNTPLYDRPTHTVSESSVRTWSNFEQDSIHIFYKITGQGDVDSFLIQYAFDTLKVIVPDAGMPSYKLKPLVQINNHGVLPGDSILLKFDHPVDRYNLDSILLTDTSGAQIAVSAKILTDVFMVQLDAKFLEGVDYKLRILPGAFHDVFDRINDTISYDFKSVSRNKLGEILVTVKGLDSLKSYTIILKKGKLELVNDLVEKMDSFYLEVADLKPDTYTISVIEDTNKNGKWDPVDYWMKSHPEILKEFELEKLRENWTLETDVIYSSGEPEEEVEIEPAQEEDK